jgi:hypothetical protein
MSLIASKFRDVGLITAKPCPLPVYPVFFATIAFCILFPDIVSDGAAKAVVRATHEAGRGAAEGASIVRRLASQAFWLVSALMTNRSA